MCTYFVLNKYYYIIILYGGSHASDILHVLMGVSVAKLIIYNIVLLFICHNKRSSSSSSTTNRRKPVHLHYQRASTVMRLDRFITHQTAWVSQYSTLQDDVRLFANVIRFYMLTVLAITQRGR